MCELTGRHTDQFAIVENHADDPCRAETVQPGVFGLYLGVATGKELEFRIRHTSKATSRLPLEI